MYLNVKVARTRPLVHQSQCLRRSYFARLQRARDGPAATARVRLAIILGASFSMFLPVRFDFEFQLLTSTAIKYLKVLTKHH